MIWLLFSVFVLFSTHIDARNTNNRVTKSVTSYLNEWKCKFGMVKYPIKDSNDYFCDCPPGFLYYEQKDNCFKPYMRGPCPENNFLVLDRKDGQAKCLRNPCNEGSVPYKNKCYELDSFGGPCKDDEMLSVNTENFSIFCEHTDFVFNRNIFEVPMIESCPKGTRRAHLNLCKFELE